MRFRERGCQSTKRHQPSSSRRYSSNPRAQFAGDITSRPACKRQKREDPIVSPRPGLLVCRKEGLSEEIASEVPPPAHHSTRSFRDRRGRVVENPPPTSRP